MIALSYRDDMDCRRSASHYLMAPQESLSVSDLGSQVNTLECSREREQVQKSHRQQPSPRRVTPVLADGPKKHGAMLFFLSSRLAKSSANSPLVRIRRAVLLSVVRAISAGRCAGGSMALRLCKASSLAQRILRPRDALPVRGGAFNPVPLGKPVSEPVRAS